ncbi:MAG: cobalamin-dependent protein, partial [Magnetococcales bacterium]|nr:cobalamin-dependent protein [Magnetococcales bacterium]
MNIAFLALGTDLASMSSRALSAYARQLGHQARIIFIPSELSLRAYSQATLDGISSLIANCDLVGITVFTSQYRLSAQITRHIKSTTPIPVFWGGIHPMIRPDECLQHADGICMGEGETFLTELLAGKPLDQIPGMWYLANGTRISNGTAPMVKDLNALPFQDFSFIDHYLVDPVTNRVGV